MHRSRTASLVLATVAAALLAFVPGASAAGHHHGHKAKAASVRSFSGTVSTVAPRRGSFSLKTKSGATVRVLVNRSTKGPKLRGLKRGQSVTVKVKRSKGRWTAARIARRAVQAGDDEATDDQADDPGDDTEDIDDMDDDDSADDTPVDGDLTQDGFPADDSDVGN